MNLLKYCRKIDTECTASDSSVLDVRAIKLDGNNSLKESLGLANVKSCDYLRLRRKQAVLIEISNLIRQQENEAESFAQVKKLTDSAGKSARKFVERLSPKKTISEELRYKCIHSLLLLHRLGDRLEFRVDEKFSCGVLYVVAICARSTSDVMAFQYLSQELRAALKGVASEVTVVPTNGLITILKRH